MADDNIIPLRHSYVLSMVERITELEAEIERLQAIVTTVDDLHSPRLAHDTCLACDCNWPCPTHLLIHPEEARRG